MVWKGTSVLEQFLVPLDELEHLDRNPRHGDEAGIGESYKTFGQVKPVLYHVDDDDVKVIVAGNHQARVARRLGWTHIAAIPFEGTDAEAIAFAIVDNRLGERGFTDQEVLQDRLSEVGDQFPTLFDSVGWDEYERAAMDLHLVGSTDVATGAMGGYVAPVMVDAPLVVENAEGEMELRAPEGTDEQSTIVGGSPATQSGAKTISQYMLVFESTEDHQRWWAFIRWIKSTTEIEGETISERLLDFVEQHADF